MALGPALPSYGWLSHPSGAIRPAVLSPASLGFGRATPGTRRASGGCESQQGEVAATPQPVWT